MEKKDVMSARKYRAQFLRQKAGKALSLFGVYFFLIVMALVVLFPFYWMLISSVKTLDEYRMSVPTFWPRVLMLENYLTAFTTANLGRLFVNTMIVGLVSTILSLFITILTAFAFARLEFKGKLGGADVYDDYAHHPTEIAATLDAARQMGYDRVICVYQPHTYSRTKGLFDEFAAALGKADLPILCDIYAARETDTLGVSSAQLAAATRGAVYMDSFDKIADFLRANARAGDLILTMGAGDIAKLPGLLLGK